MTSIDLIAVGPWILFGVVLIAVCIRLLRSRRSVLRQPPTGQQPIGRPDAQEAQCTENNSASRRR
jgi:hypothetical protein